MITSLIIWLSGYLLLIVMAGIQKPSPHDKFDRKGSMQFMAMIGWIWPYLLLIWPYHYWKIERPLRLQNKNDRVELNKNPVSYSPIEYTNYDFQSLYPTICSAVLNKIENEEDTR